ncbi:MAG: BON domain-containing protein [Pseudobdellovibrionaceae bacterium]
MPKVNRQQQTQDEHTANRGEPSSFGSQKDLNTRYSFPGDPPGENHDLPTSRPNSGLTPTDEEIEQDIKEQLAQNTETAASEIIVTVFEGEIFLEGSVYNEDTKKLAESISTQCEGVNRVLNNIFIKSPHKKSY